MKLSVVRGDVITSTGRRPNSQTPEVIISLCCWIICGEETSSAGRGFSGEEGGSEASMVVAAAASGSASDEVAPAYCGGSATGAELEGCCAAIDVVVSEV